MLFGPGLVERLAHLRLRVAAELRAQLERAHLAVFNALAAGHALRRVHPRDIVRAQHVRVVEVLAEPERKAGATAAVADSSGPVVALRLVYLVHEAVVLRPLEYLLRLFLADKAVAALLGEELGVVVDVHAHVLFQVAAAFAHQAAGAATGTGADGDGPGVVNDPLHLVIGRRVGVVFNRAAHGHDAHRPHADREIGHEDRRAVAGVALEALGDNRVFLHLLFYGQHALHDARHPDGIVVRLHVAVIDAAHYAAVGELVHLLLRVVHAHLRLFGDLLDVPRRAHLDVHSDVRHFVRHYRVEYHVLRVGGRHAHVGAALNAYLCGQHEYLFAKSHSIPHLCQIISRSRGTSTVIYIIRLW